MDYRWLIGIAFVVMVSRLVYMWSAGARARKAFRRGVEAMEANALRDAETAFRQVVRIEPIWGVAYRLLGRVLSDLGELFEAEKQFRTAITLEPRNSDAYADLGYFLEVKMTGRREDAIGALLKAVELAPRLRERLEAVPELAGLVNDARFRKGAIAED
ncbi:MAG: tetratricopeptide repeat protein [FCB group bacterium]|jgi:Flp pilus assembly protein TadD|nr:tetratricopeptide repeat protein [FCB group bacterium]